MIVTPAPLEGAWIVNVEPRVDHRGIFARTFCSREFSEHALVDYFVQCNISFNEKRGTLRGLHFQMEPDPEVKLVRCTRGRIWDVIVDLRTGSTTFMRSFALELSAANRKAIYVPRGFAHGFQSLEDETEVFYQMSAFYRPELAAGVRWNDPAFRIEWPILPPLISERDAGFMDFVP